MLSRISFLKNKYSIYIIYVIGVILGLYYFFQTFPKLKKWAPGNSSELASWVQAVGALILIVITIFLFYSEQKRLQLERKESLKYNIDEAQLFFLKHGFLFDNIHNCHTSLDIFLETSSYSGERTKLHHYRNVHVIYHVAPMVDKMVRDFEEFLVMQAPLGMPRLCASIMLQMQRDVRRCHALIDIRKSDLDRIIIYGDKNKTGLDAIDQFHLGELDLELSHYVLHITRALDNLINIYNDFQVAALDS